MPEAMAEAARKLTHDDLLRMPDDGKRYELIDGELFEMNAPISRHQRAIGNLHFELRRFVSERRLGEVWLSPFDVIFSLHNVVQPDLLFVSSDRAEIVQDWVRGVPDLAIEVLSPSNRRHDEVRKLELYERFGLPEYWIVDPEVETVKVYRLAEGRFGRAELLTARDGDVVRSPLFPSLDLPVGAIFARP